jgi:hypothetical protein
MTNSSINRTIGRLRTQVENDTGVKLDNSVLLEINRAVVGTGQTKAERVNKLDRINNYIEKQGGIGTLNLQSFNVTSNRKELAKGLTYRENLNKAIRQENLNMEINNNTPIKILEETSNIKRGAVSRPQFINRNLNILQSNVTQVANEIREILSNIVESNDGAPQTQHFYEDNKEVYNYLINRLNFIISDINSIANNTTISDEIVNISNNLEATVLGGYFVSGSDSDIEYTEIDIDDPKDWSTLVEENALNQFEIRINQILQMIYG